MGVCWTFEQVVVEMYFTNVSGFVFSAVSFTNYSNTFREPSMTSTKLTAVWVALLYILAPETVHAQFSDELDRGVADVFREKCALCHDHRDGDAGAGVDFLLDFVELVDPDNYLFDADEPEASRLLEILVGEDPDMPKRQMKNIKWNGALSASQLDTVTKWIKRGGPSEKYRQSYQAISERQIIDHETLVEAIALDLQALGGRRLEFARYLTLTNLHNNQSITADELELYRQGMVKLLNSLSHSPDVLGMDDAPTSQRVVAVDKARTIFRFDLRNIGWDCEDWEKVARHYPYGNKSRNGLGKVISAVATSSLPHMRADWFVFATSQPPLYHDLLKIEPNLQTLESRLQIDRNKNIRLGKVARAGFGESGVSQNNRMVERHAAGVSGSYWISYDFGGNSGKQDLYQNPLGPTGVVDSTHAFEHDGGEAIYTLPNGFQGYVLATADGKRISIAPNSIVHDDSMRGGQIINGISCISCHYQGMKPENNAKVNSLDQVRLNAEGAYVSFSLDELERIRELYPSRKDFAKLVEEDRQRFLAVLQKTGISRIGATEPVRALFDHFSKVLDVQIAAAGFGLSVEAFEERMNRNEFTRRIVQRIKAGGLKREKYDASYGDIAAMMGAGEVRKCEPLLLPFFGNDPDLNEPSKPQASLLDLYHKNGKLSVEMKALGDKDIFYDGDKVQCEIRTNEACFVTVVSTDSSGETTLLLPNAHHKEFKIEAGRRYVFPTPKMVENEMELFVGPPHGATSMKVIATKRPLSIEGVTPERLAEKGLIVLGNLSEGGRGAISIEENFSPNEWSTDRWTCKTRPNQ